MDIISIEDFNKISQSLEGIERINRDHICKICKKIVDLNPLIMRQGDTLNQWNFEESWQIDRADRGSPVHNNCSWSEYFWNGGVQDD